METLKLSSKNIITIDDNNVVSVNKQKYIVQGFDIEDLFYDKKYNTKISIYPGGYTKTVYSSGWPFKIRIPKTSVGSGKQKMQLDLSFMRPSERDKYLREKQRENDKRACRKIEDIVMLNPDLRYFVSLTFNLDKVDSHDKELVKKVFEKWLKDMVCDKGLKYIFVPEYHPKAGDNKIHFHGMINDVLKMVDSHTRKVRGFEKPVRLTKIGKWLRKGKITEDDILCTVYNMPEWTFGFSTAMELEKNQGSVVCYITKYIQKDVEGKNRIFGKRYWSSRNISTLPIVKLENISSDEFEALPLKRYDSRYDNNSYKYKNNWVNKRE